MWLPPRLLRGRALEALYQWTVAAECYSAAKEILVQKSKNTKRSSVAGEIGEEEAERADAAAVRAGRARAETALADKSCVAVMAGHSAPVTTVAFMPALAATPPSSSITATPSPQQAQVLASASDDGTVRLWQAPSGWG